MTEIGYAGQELDLFAEVHNWKTYWSASVRPYIKGNVLEAGAGTGSNTALMDAQASSWTCLEPDPALAARLRQKVRHPVLVGTIQDLEPVPQFDTIVYIDVLEHIEHDRRELDCASQRLNPGGRVVVLSPAHQWLYSPFDAAIGHFRRYNKASLRAAAPASLRLEAMFYLDSAGLTLSAANRLLLKQSMPTKAQLAVWDRWVVPVSRALDPLLRRSVGKSIVGVWNKR